MSISKEEVVQLYRKRARNYDVSANLYYLIGFREQAYRKRAVRALGLTAGDTVVEIGCGTGLNFARLRRAVGVEGKIIGLDMTDGMLRRARARAQRQGWTNIQLVQQDAAGYEFPERVDGIISTFAITLVPEFEQVIERAARALRPGGRFVILDLKRPERAPLWVAKLGVLITRPFGVTLDLMNRHPWEAIEKHFSKSSTRELYMGFAYLSVGEAA